jgi:3',5'-cyclic AMP phosphodiesterase CpdA
MTPLIHILHLSDIHLGTLDQATTYYNRLHLDLTQNLNLDKLDYLLISGDIANKSTPDEYKAAFKFVNQIQKSFGLKENQVIIAPGNHDLNWDLSAEAYSNYIPRACYEL